MEFDFQDYEICCNKGAYQKSSLEMQLALVKGLGVNLLRFSSIARHPPLAPPLPPHPGIFICRTKDEVTVNVCGFCVFYLDIDKALPTQQLWHKLWSGLQIKNNWRRST